ncbi:hypothetical protein BDV3_004168 [Batrachochytrium dendrobatidis]|nr:hypothetical protein O5D80_008702 [Batrachochytrium dendrobatidis]
MLSVKARFGLKCFIGAGLGLGIGMSIQQFQYAKQQMDLDQKKNIAESAAKAQDILNRLEQLSNKNQSSS